MRTLLAAIIVLISFGANASKVTFTFTNSVGIADTHPVKVYALMPPTTGAAFSFVSRFNCTLYPDNTGYCWTNLQQGTYTVENPFLGDGITFAVPSDTNTYPVGQLAVNGFSVPTYSPFVKQITNSDGTLSVSPSDGHGVIDLKVKPVGEILYDPVNADLGLVVSNNLRSFWVGKTTNSNWKFYNGDGVTLSQTNWAIGIDFSGLALRNKTGADDLALITKRHAITAAHAIGGLTVGSPVVFNSTNSVGGFYTNFVQSLTNPVSDIMVVTLSNDVPSDVIPFAVLPAIATNYVSATGLPVIWIRNNPGIPGAEHVNLQKDNILSAFPQSDFVLDPTCPFFDGAATSGDSGSPAFTYVNGYTVFMFSTFEPGLVGPWVSWPAYWPYVIAQLGGYTVNTVDLSNYQSSQGNGPANTPLLSSALPLGKAIGVHDRIMIVKKSPAATEIIEATDLLDSLATFANFPARGTNSGGGGGTNSLDIRPLNNTGSSSFFGVNAFSNAVNLAGTTTSYGVLNTIGDLVTHRLDAGSDVFVYGSFITGGGHAIIFGAPIPGVHTNGVIYSSGVAGAPVQIFAGSLDDLFFGGTHASVGFLEDHFKGNGSEITNIDAGHITGPGSLADGNLSGNVTLKGNVFNGANQLVQLDLSTRLPSVDGSQLLNLNASQLLIGTMPVGRMPALTGGDFSTPAGSGVGTLNSVNSGIGTFPSDTAHMFLGTFGAKGLATSAGQIGIFANQGTITTVMHGNASGLPSFGTVVEADQSLSDVTTWNVTTGHHGYMAKLDGNASHYYDGNGGLSTPPGAGGIQNNSGLGTNTQFYITASGGSVDFWLTNGTKIATFTNNHVEFYTNVVIDGTLTVNSPTNTLTVSNLIVTGWAEISNTIHAAGGFIGNLTGAATTLVSSANVTNLQDWLSGSPTFATFKITTDGNANDSFHLLKDGTWAFQDPNNSFLQTFLFNANSIIFGTNLTIKGAETNTTIVSGLLAADNLGKRSAVSTSAGIAAILSDETGAGLAVFSGAPTLTNTLTHGDVNRTNSVYVDNRGVTITNNLTTIQATNGQVYASGGITAGGVFSGNGGSLDHLPAGNLTGGVWRVDIPGFALIPADSGSMSFVTNTPGTAQGGIQGSGPSRMMWQVTSTGTNVYAVFPLPYNYDGGTINTELWFTGGTNGVTKTTNVVTCAASTFGSALGTALTVTNRVDTVGVSTFWTTNTQFAAITIGGSPSAGRSVTVQFSVNNTAPQYSITNLLCAHHASIWGTCSATQRGSITMP